MTESNLYRAYILFRNGESVIYTCEDLAPVNKNNLRAIIEHFRDWTYIPTVKGWIKVDWNEAIFFSLEVL